MRKLVAWLPMHACFWTGHFASKILDRIPDWEARTVEKIASAIYWVYNRGMCASVDLNDWAGFSFWRKGDESSATSNRS